MSQTIPSTDHYLNLMNDHGIFRPFYSPRDMLQLGVYQGAYFINKKPSMLAMVKDLLNNIPVNKYLSNPSNSLNYFQVQAPDTGEYHSGLVPGLRALHPGGWFEWYCKFYYGEKSRADHARVRQWLYTVNAQWFYIMKGPYTNMGTQATDLTWLPERRQKMLEFGADPTVDPSLYGCFYKF